MKNQKRFILSMFTILIFVSLQVAVLGQEAKVANVRAEGMAVRFDSAIPYSNATLTISGPDGTVYRREFTGGTAPSLSLFDKTGAALGNGQYTYELRFTTVQTPVASTLEGQGGGTAKIPLRASLRRSRPLHADPLVGAPGPERGGVRLADSLNTDARGLAAGRRIRAVRLLPTRRSHRTGGPRA